MYQEVTHETGILPIEARCLASLDHSRCATPVFSASQAKKEHDPPVPLAWLTVEEKARFEAGRQLFEFPFTPKEGLGPVFNGWTCEACHHIPTIGGSGPGYRGNIRYIYPSTRSTQGLLFHDKSIARGPAEALPDNAIISKRRPGTLLVSRLESHVKVPSGEPF